MLKLLNVTVVNLKQLCAKDTAKF